MCSQNKKKKGSDNKFHFNELTYEEAKYKIDIYFQEVEFYGTHYRKKNLFRAAIQKSFLYRALGLARFPEKVL